MTGRPAPKADQRSLPRRAASAAKASLRRTVSFSVKRLRRRWQRTHHGYLVWRKRTLERWKDMQAARRRFAKRSLRKRKDATYWLKYQLKRLRRLITKRSLDPFGRTRTLKRAEELDVVSLDVKPYETRKGRRRREIREVCRQVSRLARSKKPIVVGPWLSEIGFEILYWIPFLHWAKVYGGLPERRLWVVSRGGVADWYRYFTPNYIEAFDEYTPEQFAALNEDRIADQGELKHRELARLDEQLIEVARRRIGSDDVDLLHPSLMYNLYHPFFTSSASARLVESFSLYRDLRRPLRRDELPEQLPGDYVAVKFYANTALPGTEPNTQFAARLLERLTRDSDVVLLDTGFEYDDHSSFDIRRERIHTLEGLAAPSENLDLQTRVIRGARAFYCTYGGFSYLAPLCGTNTVTFYSNPDRFRVEHLEVAQRVFRALDCPPFLALDVAEIEVLEQQLAFLGQRGAARR